MWISRKRQTKHLNEKCSFESIQDQSKTDCLFLCRSIHGIQDNLLCSMIYNIKMKVCMSVRQPAAGPTQPITPKFGMGSSFHLGSEPSQGATQNVGPRPFPWPAHFCSLVPQIILTGLFHNCSGQRRVAHTCIFIKSGWLIIQRYFPMNTK